MQRVTGIGGIFIKARDPERMKDWYRRHLSIDIQSWGGTSFRWQTPERPEPDGMTVWSIFPPDTRYFDPDGAEPTQPIAAGELYVDTPPWAGGTPVAMSPVDGAFNSTVEAATATIDTTGFASGRHLLYVRGRDSANNWLKHSPLIRGW